MKRIEELVNTEEPGIDVIREFLDSAENKYELLPPSEKRNEILLNVQVTTRSTMGAMVYDTGGLIIEDGWLRFLGSGHERIARDLAVMPPHVLPVIGPKSPQENL